MLSRNYVACPPPVQREMTLREIHAHLAPLMPSQADEQAALFAQHPGRQQQRGARRGQA